jgi:hypothetical protein
MSKFIHELRAGDTLQVGDAVIRLIEKSGKRARLEVSAPVGTVSINAQECSQNARSDHGKHPVRLREKAVS